MVLDIRYVHLRISIALLCAFTSTLLRCGWILLEFLLDGFAVSVTIDFELATLNVIKS